ncbi:MAG: hypothetical protein EZS26_001090 [Candidatus Ordinivivax streblomastigis]|uniref:Peptidase S74 domain-containing protein n=1 Tax=Candidatus Ordinivivax streblomastigis TaxID=2540710 RepID=A0A5M8P2B1_9BACT|nr:MAG: hypothetical protein EZS26_001090 [Candidatus Ordinivivax streblomastigis]
MKKIKLVICLLFCLPLVSYTQLRITGGGPAGGNSGSMTEPGIIEVSCSEYTNNLSKKWDVAISSHTRLKIDYEVNLETNYDKVVIYATSQLSSSTENRYIQYELATLTGSKKGTVYSNRIDNGVVYLKVLFTTDASVCCNSGNTQLSGFKIAISREDKGDSFGDITVNGTITGNSTGGALRVDTHYGYLDLGPQNSLFSHLSTDRGKFLFNKPIFLEDGKLGAYDTQNLSLQTNATDRMTILGSNGNVGIGTTSPKAKLDITGDVYIPTGKSYWIGSTTDTGNRLRLHHSTYDAYIDFMPNLYFRNGSSHTVVALKANGNVGIGTASPTNLLDVNGTIHAKEVKIDNINWPDYVFSNDYQLLPLNKVKLHIDENKHLPGIPTEAEVKENGVNVGEMQTKLLQKIEELTLYLIQQQETIEALKTEMQELKEK